VASEDVAAVIAEPVLGEGGFVAPPPEFFRIVTEICRKHGVLFIADEVQSGFGRTGRMFACEHYGIEPDILVTAKSLGGGLPLAAVTGRSEIMDAPGVGGLGGTFAGNPLSCAAANAVLDVFECGDLLSRASSIGERFQKRAQEWKTRFEIIGEVRGLGAMRAIELVKSRETREPADEETKRISQYCYEHGLITITAGTYGNVIRLLVPLVISDEQMEEGDKAHIGGVDAKEKPNGEEGLDRAGDIHPGCGRLEAGLDEELERRRHCELADDVRNEKHRAGDAQDVELIEQVEFVGKRHGNSPRVVLFGATTFDENCTSWRASQPPAVAIICGP
jgi:hypothetical protein